MVVLDARGIEINVHSHVRYTRTGTVGEVLDIKTEGRESFILIDKSELWYNTDFIEVLDYKDVKNRKFRSADDHEVDVDKLKNQKDKFENMELSSDVAEGGG